MYVASLLGLSYDIYAIGKTKEECKANAVKAFEKYLKAYEYTLEAFCEDRRIDLKEYDNGVATLLEEYYGLNMFDVTKGYALGWE